MMMSCEQVRELLLDLLYDALDDAEATAVRAHIESCEACRAARDEARGDKALLGEASRLAAPELSFEPPIGESRRKRAGEAAAAPEPARPSRGWRLAYIAASAFAASALIAAFVTSHVLPRIERARAEARVREATAGQLRLIAQGPAPAAAGAPQHFVVQSRSADGAPVAATVKWSLRAGETEIVAGEAKTDAQGNATLDVAADALLAGDGSYPAALEMHAEAISLDGVARGAVVAKLGVDPIRHSAHLGTDKPLYRPGETVRFRALVVERFSLKPVADRTPVQFQVKDPRGSVVAAFPAVTENGVAWAEMAIPAGAPGGAWKLLAAAPDGRFPAVERDVMVRSYRAPRLKKKIELLRDSYGPGDEVVADIAVERTEGGAAAGAKLRATATVDGEVVKQWEETAARDGHALLRFTLPEKIERGETLLSVAVDDGGTVETVSEPVQVAVGKLQLEAFPEGGDLVAGLPGRVYLRIRTLTDEPAAAKGRVLDADDREVARFETGHEGLARFALTPKTGAAYRVVVDEPKGIETELTLPACKPEGYVLAAERDVYAAGEPIAVTVHSSADDAPIAVSAFCRGTLVAQTTLLAKAGSNRVTLTPRESLGTWGGVVRVTVYDDHLAPVAERLVWRASDRKLKVELLADRDRYAPADSVKVRVRTVDENGDAVPAIVSLSVVDDGVLVMADDEMPRLRTDVLLASEVGEPERTDFYLGDDPEAPRALDLLLGTQGWRRFVERDPKQFVDAHGEIAKRLLALSGVDRTVVADNGEAIAQAVAAAEREHLERAFEAIEHAASTHALTGGLALLALVFFGGLTLGSGWIALRRGGLRHLALPVVGIALAVAVFATADSTDLVGRDGVARYYIDQQRAKLVAHAGAHSGVEELMAREQPIIVLEGELFEELAAVDHAGDKLDLAANGLALDNEQVMLLAEAKQPRQQDEVERRLLVNKEIAGKDIDGRFANRLEGFVDGIVDFKNVRGRHAAGYYYHVYTREFAHTRDRAAEDAAGGARRDFTETLYWNPALVTGPRGEAEIAFDLSDAVTSFRVRADGHAHGGRLGEADDLIESRIPFYLEPKLPLAVSAGDRIDLPLAVVNDADGRLEVDVALGLTGNLIELGGPGDARHTVLEAGQRVRLWYPLAVGSGQGEVGVAFSGDAGRLSDRVERTVTVVSRGFPIEKALSGVLEKQDELTVAIPADLVPGSLTARLRLFPSTLATLAAGIEGMLREPGGCFEQASSSNYPNVMALSYMQRASDEVDVAFLKRANEVLAKGYELLTGYECAEKGYEWFGGDPGHEALTAYGLMEFIDMARVHDAVDRKMIDRTAEWLLARRDGKGGFARNSRALDSFGRAPEETTNAYIVWAITEAGDAFAIDRELDALAEVGKKSDDSYVIALAANALLNRKRPEGRALLAKLVEAQTADGKIAGAKSSITCSGGANLDVETTALAVLAFLRDSKQEHAGQAEAGVRWILANRNAGGGFYATQATVLALRALVAHAEANRRPTSPGELVVLIDGTEVARVAFDEKHRGAIEVNDLQQHLTPGKTHAVKMTLSGQNAFPFTLGIEYRADTAPSAGDCPVGLDVALGAEKVRQGDTVRLSAKVTNGKKDDGLPMVVAILGLPAGLEPIAKQLEELRDAGKVAFYETRPREVILYWRAMEPGQTVDVGLDLVAAIPGAYTAPASRAYLYYDDQAKSWRAPLAIEIERPQR